MLSREIHDQFHYITWNSLSFGIHYHVISLGSQSLAFHCQSHILLRIHFQFKFSLNITTRSFRSDYSLKMQKLRRLLIENALITVLLSHES